MSTWLVVLILVVAIPAFAWTAVDFLRDFLLFVEPEETARRRLMRRHGEGPTYKQALARIEARKPYSLILLSLAGLVGMAGTAWIIFG